MFKNKLLVFFILLTLLACSPKEVVIDNLEKKDLESQFIEIYTEAYEKLEEGENVLAARKFNEAETLYPQSKWAPKSILMAAYSYYEVNYFQDAILEVERFIFQYSNHSAVSYAHYLKAICYFESVVDEKKDLKPLLNAKKEFIYIIKNYPQTDFALDSKYKLELINNIIAAKEMYIAKYYLQRGKWISAINRLKKITTEYDTSVYTPEALHRLVEVHYKIGLEDEAKKYASILGYNYLSDRWYKETYKIFNKNYSDPLLEVKREKKSLLKKFKSLF